MLNRVVRWTPEGYELEADLRHAELVIEHLELESSKKVITPGTDIDVQCAAWDVEGEEPEGEEPNRRSQRTGEAMTHIVRTLAPTREAGLASRKQRHPPEGVLSAACASQGELRAQ